MQPSASILAYIKGTESLRLVAYLPTPNDVPTNGYGSTGADIHVGDRWTLEQAEARFATFCANEAVSLTKALGGARTTQNQFDAMFSLAYNIGMGNFLKSSVLRDHKAGNYGAETSDFLKWVKQAGKTLGGLVTRRKKEAEVYEKTVS